MNPESARSEAMVNEFERSLIENPSLPTVPAIAQRLLQLMEEGAGLEELAEVISVDPALSAKIVRVINSSMYAMSREITAVREAVLYLGTASVTSIALSFSFVSSFRSPNGDRELEQLWQSSLMTSLAARRLALEVGDWDSEEAFLIGLLCDCGALLMHAALPEYGELVTRFYRGELDLLEAERSAFDSDHPRIGALLLEKWAFPRRYCSLIARHHEPPTEADPEHFSKQRILHCAWMCSRALTISGYVNQTASLSQQLGDTLAIPRSVSDSILEELPSELRSIAASLDIALGEQRSYQDLLSEANTALVDLALGQDRTVRALAGTVGSCRSGFEDVLQALEPSVVRDEATGLMNRASFEFLLEAFHERSKQRKIPLGLLIVECDPGDGCPETADPLDHLLRRTAGLIASILRSSDPFTRLAARQIAVLLPSCEAEHLKSLVERVHNSLTTDPETALAKTPPRFAIGSAESQPYYPDCDPQQLIIDAFANLERSRVAE
ncbi:MAG: HDOD domain-containing protein [Myxococcota bacterium]